MSFHQQNFTQRFGTMGDPAEAAFDRVYPKHHKLGLNRPPFYMGGMPAPMRYTPDRMLRDRLVECMGIGKDGLLKLKDEKLDALFEWQFVGPVHLFVYNSHTNTYCEAPLSDWVRQLHLWGTPRTFEVDAKAYTELAAERFPADTHPLPEADDAT